MHALTVLTIFNDVFEIEHDITSAIIICFSEFFKAGNYLGAISAYSLGIKISDKMASLYVNRSAAHYALENYYRCIEDCSKVITRFDTCNLMELIIIKEIN